MRSNKAGEPLPLCKEANVSMADYIGQRQQGSRLVSARQHSAWHRYTNFACRCEDCTRAQREADRKYRANNPEKVRAANARYTENAYNRHRLRTFLTAPRVATAPTDAGAPCADRPTTNVASATEMPTVTR